MLTELIELDCKMKEEMKGTQNKIKQNIQESTVKGRKPGPKSMIWNKRKKETPYRFLPSEVLRIYFPVLEPWAAGSVLVCSCSSQFISIQMWDCLLFQLPPHPSSPPAATSLRILSALAAHLHPSYQSE
ncbi:hypothetical protein HJG60_011254 [Phyllostomus discolor]|uniref:Uncharacterized protein n=1 Tax=Phyllostomus discolor TaxID=89673 RepID=A0A834A464_9CHIR|nr:hypothetical protein HJG60_011254 [Phyllostomus discolor]